jgi:hypothetical protein
MFFEGAKIISPNEFLIFFKISNQIEGGGADGNQ